ncbi:Rrf2 family transcriptional regulator [Candidatus Bathycorpusculum sp.]|uniref:RrF2 family transcriptional regulator n=1 Tax=Candidatus Bathycorpusculum sp. TaxID=2994959 RepID=UPI0031CCC496
MEMSICHRETELSSVTIGYIGGYGMQLNVTTDYGIRVVLYLANKNGVASSNEICMEMGIPCTYMHKIARTLKNAGIIREIRGSTGGFVLQKDPDNLSILHIVSAFEKTMNINRCMEEDKFCSRDAVPFCPVRDLYVEAQAEFHNKLNVKISHFLKQS